MRPFYSQAGRQNVIKADMMTGSYSNSMFDCNFEKVEQLSRAASHKEALTILRSEGSTYEITISLVNLLANILGGPVQVKKHLVKYFDSRADVVTELLKPLKEVKLYTKRQIFEKDIKLAINIARACPIVVGW